MAFTCRACGDEGHYARSCPNPEVLDTRPTWCGRKECDPDTRQIAMNAAGTLVKRCPDCHDTPSKPLPQHSRCPRCKTTVYKWDFRTECGSHIEVGKQIEPYTQAS